MEDIKEMLQTVISMLENKIAVETNSQKLIFLKEKYQSALCELEMFGKIETDLNGMIRQYLDSYSDYMNNPLIDKMEELDKSLKAIDLERQKKVEMVSTRQIKASLEKHLLDGYKVPHRVSFPVLYRDADKVYLAAFAFFYTRTDIEDGYIRRPTFWALVDISSGEIVARYQSKDKDFSDAPYDVRYNIRTDKQYDTSKDHYAKAYDLMDKVRIHYLETGEILMEDYEKYLSLILANIPDSYQRFYTDLSRI